MGKPLCKPLTRGEKGKKPHAQDEPSAPVWKTELHRNPDDCGNVSVEKCLYAFPPLWDEMWHFESISMVPLFFFYLATDFSDKGFERGIVLEMELQSKAKTFHVRRESYWNHCFILSSRVWVVGFSAADFEQNPIFTLCVTQQAHLLPSSPPFPSSWPPQGRTQKWLPAGRQDPSERWI